MDLMEIRRRMMEEDPLNLVRINTKYTSGYYINASGVVTESSAYRYTPDYIKIKPNTTYNVSMKKTSDISAAFTVALYDAGYNFVERISAIPSAQGAGTGVKAGQFQSSSNERYIRFSLPNSSTDIKIYEMT